MWLAVFSARRLGFLRSKLGVGRSAVAGIVLVRERGAPSAF
jgi:hypothetical protein